MIRFTYRFYKEDTGLSLISTLWILTILSVLAAQLLYSIHIEQRTQRNFLDRAKFHYAARAGFEWSLATMRADETPFDSLGETWATPLEGQIEDGVQVGNFLNYSVAVSDEAAKVNINTADVGLLTNLLTQAGASPDDAITEELANRIVEGRPYRTVRDVARVEGMTTELLYGVQQQSSTTQQSTSMIPMTPMTPTSTAAVSPISTNTEATTGITGLVDLATVYSVDASTDPEGQPLVDLNTAEAGDLTQINTEQNQPVFSEAEAESLIQQREYDRLAALLEVQAVSDDLFDNISNRLTTEDADGDSEENGSDDEGNININTADAETLQSLDGVDEGIADRIIDHRESQGLFQNIDAIKEVRLLTQQEFIDIVDKITLKEGETRPGLINVNTAPAEVLALLPGMDPDKAEAIVDRREEDAPDPSQFQNFTEDEITGNPFMRISEVSELEAIDFATFREMVDWITYRSHGYRIEANGVDPAGKIVSQCIGIIDRTGDQVITQYWQQD